MVALGPEGLTVAAAGGAVLCGRARDGGQKSPAAEVARVLGLEAGVRLGSSST